MSIEEILSAALGDDAPDPRPPGADLLTAKDRQAIRDVDIDCGGAIASDFELSLIRDAMAKATATKISAALGAPAVVTTEVLAGGFAARATVAGWSNFSEAGLTREAALAKLVEAAEFRATRT